MNAKTVVLLSPTARHVTSAGSIDIRLMFATNHYYYGHLPITNSPQ